MTGTGDKPFGFWTATSLVVGVMIGAGIFVLPAQLAPYGAWSILAWLTAMGGSLLLATVLVSLHKAYPDAAGAVALVERGLGPLGGMLVGWSYWVSVLTANAFIALAAASYASTFMPLIGKHPNAPGLFACLLIAALTALNILGPRVVGWFQIGSTAAKLTPLILAVGLIVYIFATGQAQIQPLPAAPLGGNWLAPLTLAMFALLGFEAASLTAARVDRPEVNVARATMAGLLIAGGLYVVLCTGMALALPIDFLAGSPAPFALLFDRFAFAGSGTLVAACAVISAVGALNGGILLQGEVPRTMALTGTLSPWFARLNARAMPVGTILLSSALSIGLVLTQLGGGLREVLDFMITLTTATSLWLYAAIALTGLRLGVARWAAGAGLVFALLVIWGTGWQVSLLSLALMLSGLPFYRRNPPVTSAATSG